MNMSRRLFGSILLLFLVAWCLVLAGPLGAQEKNSLAPEAMLEVLTEGAASLEKGIAEGKADAEELQQKIEQEEASLQNLRARIATLKASQAAGELQLPRAQEVLDTFSERQEQVAAQLQEVQGLRDKLAQQLAIRINAFRSFQQEVERLKAAHHPTWDSPEVRKAYDRYQQLIEQYQTGVTRSLELWDQVILILNERHQALNQTTQELKNYVEVGWKEDLLERRGPVPLMTTIKQTWQTLWELPERLGSYLTDPRVPQKIAASLRVRWAQFLGLLAILLLVVWITPRLRRMLLPRLRQWQSEAPEPGLKVIFRAAELIFFHLFGLGFLAWLALATGIMGWWQREEARIIFLVVLVWVGLRLGLALIQSVFAGKERGGILPWEETAVRPYRRHLKLLLVYVLVIEVFGLNLVQLLDLEAKEYVNLETLLEAGSMLWVWWLLRRPYLDNLRAELAEPVWTKVRVFFLIVRVLVSLVLVAILLTSLLGFQTLSAYIARGTSLTGLLLVLFWVTWQAARAVLDHALYPEEGVPEETLRQDEILRKYSLDIMKVVVTVLVVGAFFLILKLWGIDLGFLQLFVEGLRWGPTLGPFSLNLLSLGLAVLTLYLGRWFSRFLRALLEVRFYPRTDWDESIRYTVSNTFHYTIQAVAILLALGFLGVSFGDLAIVAAGLGVGIGFGLQNIVNNFISGLILLFERPIKVGDMLIIDGQWGAVKEIRVRSTIFQTYDRYVLIIPNSELISNKVLNWTYYGPGVNRLTLKIGVSYGSDVHQVTKILDEVCRANPRVLDNPPPLIYFEAYGDSSLNFNIWVHVRSPSDRIATTHELNSAIFEAFQEHGIEIPFPQRDLYVKSWPDVPRPLAAESEDEAHSPPEQPSGPRDQSPKR